MTRGSNLLWAAAIGGGLYWASKQPGGINGVWNRFSTKVKEIQDSPDPLGTLKRQVNEARYKNAADSDSALYSNNYATSGQMMNPSALPTENQSAFPANNAYNATPSQVL